MIRYALPHTSTDAYALIHKCFTHFSWCFGGVLVGVLVGVFAVEYWVGIVEKFVEFRFFFIIRLIEKYFTFFLPSICGFFTLFLPNIGVEITFFLPNVRGVWGCEFCRRDGGYNRICSYIKGEWIFIRG